MKQQIEKIQALLVRGVYAAAEHELEQLMAECGNIEQQYDNINKLGGLLYAENKKLKEQVEQLTKERDALLAEREQMMKQEPVATVHNWVGARAAKDQVSLIVDVPAGFTFLRGQKLYASPLPAQQIPEGYAIAEKIVAAANIRYFCNELSGKILDESKPETVEVPTKFMKKIARLLRDNHKNEESPTWYPGTLFAHELAEEIKAMLSASQPKGDV